MIFQPPPPPLNPPSLLALGSITLMIGITFLMQAIVIFTSSFVIREYRGVRAFFLSTLCLSLGFFLLLFHPQFGFAIGITSNIAIYTGNMLMYLAICQFTEKPPQRWILYILIPLGYFALLLTFFLRIPIIVITESANIPLSIASAYTLIKSDNKAFRLSAYLTALPLFLYALVSLMKVTFGIVSPAEIAPGQTAVNSTSILIVYVLSFLWTTGFIFMISQRLQHQLNELAMNDMLTRVRNRRAMHELLNYEFFRDFAGCGSLQARQRHIRSRYGRRGFEVDGGKPATLRAYRRHGLALGRRRVLDPAPRHRARGSGRSRGTDARAHRIGILRFQRRYLEDHFQRGRLVLERTSRCG